MKHTQSNYQFSQSYYIGIDVHKNSWKVAIRFDGQELRTTSLDPSGKQLRQWVDRHFGDGRYMAIYEAGFTGFSTYRSLQAHGFESVVVHPSDIPTTDRDRRKKTDKVDCRRLARNLENYYRSDRSEDSREITPLYVPDLQGEALRDLWRLREHTVKDLSRIKNRIWSFLDKWGLTVPASDQLPRWSQTFVRYLREELTITQPVARLGLDQLLDRYQQICEQLKTCNRNLASHLQQGKPAAIINAMRSQPGVGALTAMGFYAELIDIRRFANTEKLSRYVGLAPDVHQSGDRQADGRVGSRCNKRVRRLLIEAAWVAIRKDDELHQHWRRYIQRMPKQKAIIRIARKLAVRLRRLWLNQLVESPKYE